MQLTLALPVLYLSLGLALYLLVNLGAHVFGFKRTLQPIKTAPNGSHQPTTPYVSSSVTAVPTTA